MPLRTIPTRDNRKEEHVLLHVGEILISCPGALDADGIAEVRQEILTCREQGTVKAGIARHSGLETAPEQQAARSQRPDGASAYLCPDIGWNVDVADKRQIELGLVAKVGGIDLNGRHIQLAFLCDRPELAHRVTRQIDCRRRPAPLGQPEAVVTVAGADVEYPPRRQRTRQLDDHPVRLGPGQRTLRSITSGQEIRDAGQSTI
ncbi:MAG: hypothetical protein R2849_23300 [Thermomicrobiales bacterium]